MSANLKADRSSKTGKFDFIVSQVYEEQDLEFYVKFCTSGQLDGERSDALFPLLLYGPVLWLT